MSPDTVGVLMRHFRAAILRPPLLTELGADYLRRTIAGIAGILIVLGFFLPRAFFHRYVELNAMVSREPYYRAVQADTLMMIALPMVIIGVAAVMLAPLLFPDETDYRVLTPLPVTRAELFLAKLLAVAIVVVTAVLAVTIVSSIWFPLATGGRRALHPAWARVAAHAVATICGSLWMCSAAMAVQGVSLTLLPSRWQRRGGLILQAIVLVGLLLSIPLIIRMPSMLVTEDTVIAAPLVLMPPAWFLGLEQVLLSGGGAGGYAMAARIAAVASVLTMAAIIAAYLRLFVSAERLAGLSGDDRGRRRSVVSWLRRLRPQSAATIAFIWTGLTRSRLHQFVLLIIVAGAAALLIAQIASASVNAVLGAPLTLALAILLGLRQAFLLPLDRGAAWMFRTTEDEKTRSAVLDGVAYVCVAAALIPPMVVAAVIQPAVLGSSAWAAMLLTLMTVLVMVEVVLSEWQRIPFACTYLPGKHVLAYGIGVLIASYFAVGVIGSNLIRWAIQQPVRTLALALALVAGLIWLRRARLETWGRLPLEFEDYNPAEVRKLGFVPDERP